MSNNFNTKPHFPFTYGDDIANDGQRLSDFIVNKLSEKETRSYLGAIFVAILALGSQAAPSNAIPPEYGEAATEATKGTGQQAVNLGNGGVCGTQQLPNNLQGQPNQPIVPEVPGQKTCVNSFHNVPVNTPQGSMVLNGNTLNGNAQSLASWQDKNKQLGLALPNPPVSANGRKLNTIALVASGLWICLNGAWGNPVFLGGCLGMLLTAAGKNIFN